MTTEQIVGKTAVITIPTVDEKGNQQPLQLTIGTNSIDAGVALYAALEELVRQDRQKHIAVGTQVFQAIKEYSVGTQVLSDSFLNLMTSPVSVYQVETMRNTLGGLHVELLHRSKQYHPDMTLEKIAAVVNVANMVQIREDLTNKTAHKST